MPAAQLTKASALFLTISTREAGPCLGTPAARSWFERLPGTAEGYRLDSAQARAFLSGFVPRP